MLQQTQVATVIPYFHKWMEKFPTFYHLSRAPLEQIIKSWEGLGYYSRARNLHKLSKIIDETQIIPKAYEELIKLPGIGDYTASAIMAFAFNQPIIAVDGNVLRVGARFFGISDDIKNQKTKQKIKALFQSYYLEASSFAESLIELGACICKKKPNCEICPLKQSCHAYNENKQELLPVSLKKQKTIKMESDIALVFFEDQILVKKNQEGIMKDLYQFPKVNEVNENKDLFTPINKKFYQTFTHFHETLTPFVQDVKDKFFLNNCEWFSYKELEHLPFTSGHRKILKLIKEMKSL
jgi:A/G-specific adenine glycosylase